MKWISTLILLLSLSIIGLSQGRIGGSGVCHVSIDPNSISDMQTRNPESDCMIAHNYLSGDQWRFIDANPPGEKWEELPESEFPIGGINGHVLQTDGSGNYSWVAQSSGGGSGGSSGGSSYCIKISGRAYCNANGNWVTPSSRFYGPNSFQFSEQAGSGADPLVEWENLGHFMKSGETIKDVSFSGVANNNEITDLRIAIVLSRPIAGWEVGADNDAEMETVTLLNTTLIAGSGITAQTTDITARTFSIDHTLTEDYIMHVFYQAVGSFSAVRYYYTTLSIDVESASSGSGSGGSGGGGTADGNGIYDGSGTIPLATQATLSDKFSFMGGNIGINESNPTYPLSIGDFGMEVSYDGLTSDRWTSYSSTASLGNFVNARRARGSQSAPVDLLEDDLIYRLTPEGYSGGFNSLGHLTFYKGPGGFNSSFEIGTAFNRTDFEIDSNGNIDIGGSLNIDAQLTLPNLGTGNAANLVGVNASGVTVSVDPSTVGGTDGVVTGVSGANGSASRNLDLSIGSSIPINVEDGDSDDQNEIETWSTLAGIPADIADGDDDTQLSESQVDAYANNNGYLITEIDGSVTNEIELPPGGSNGQLLQTDGSGNYSWTAPSSGSDGNGIYDGAGSLNSNADVSLNARKIEFIGSQGSVEIPANGTQINFHGAASSVDRIKNQNGNYMRLEPNSGKSLQVLTSDGSTHYSVFREDGKVGIGTLNPSEQFEVSGNAKVNNDLILDSDIVDSNGSQGTNGQLLGRDNGGVIWQDASTVPSGGLSGQVLSTDGSDNLSWVDDQTGGGGSSDGVVNGASGIAGDQTRDLNRTVGNPVTINVEDADSDPTNEIETWSTLAGIPSDILDGDDDTDTQLSEAQVDAFANNNGYLTSETHLSGVSNTALNANRNLNTVSYTHLTLPTICSV